MPEWMLFAAVAWMFLVAAVIFLALGRISAELSDEKLTRAGLGGADPLHLRLRQVIQTEDRLGIALTVAVVIASVILAIVLAGRIWQGATVSGLL